MEFENDIKCNLFLDTGAVIKNTEVKIKDAKTGKERRYFVQDILLEAGTLLSCSDYNTQNSDCIKCHSVLRKFIQEYSSLAEDRQRRRFHV